MSDCLKVKLTAEPEVVRPAEQKSHNRCQPVFIKSIAAFLCPNLEHSPRKKKAGPKAVGRSPATA